MPSVENKYTESNAMAGIEMINEAKLALTKMLEHRITDIEFGLNNKIVRIYSFNWKLPLTQYHILEKVLFYPIITPLFLES